VPIALAVLVTAEFALAGNELDWSLLDTRLAAFLPTLVFVALLQGGNEEPGWRGFALPRMQDRFTPVRATLLLGGVWALWHLPPSWSPPMKPATAWAPAAYSSSSR
jgi:uncharacterized protein